MHNSFHRRVPRHIHQNGVSLIFALLTLAVLMLGTLALVRAIDTGSLVLGNIGFKNDATAAADQATRSAITWLTSNADSLDNDAAASGYYATNRQFGTDGTTPLGPLDVTTQQFPTSTTRQLVDWDGDTCASTSAGTFKSCVLTTADAGTINGNAARYIIFRQCSKVGDYSANISIVCTRPVGGSGGGPAKKGELNYAEAIRLSGSVPPYYRIIVRVRGARNTVSFTETLVHF